MQMSAQTHYQAELDAGRFCIQQCPQCGKHVFTPRELCPHCGASPLRWVRASGLGTVRALSVVSRAPSDDFRALAPYTLVIVELDEGPRLMGHADAAVQMGQRVRAGYFEHQGRTLLRFAAQP
ncbi:hypothetical protein SDC9_86051 [bioreactor metagenome]|uniref:DUF35 domain-containing protein n=1 Tax=bioreactor metagenome TaxID=1076179 RepID=A0A644ZGH1_9ZZZZ